ncbi:hypothetical protein HOY80DRAFT_954573 [Tuber brumale]|nr:hypothetical protein HOY80DRAFT_954573 [Tuber brumale]
MSCRSKDTRVVSSLAIGALFAGLVEGTAAAAYFYYNLAIYKEQPITSVLGVFLKQVVDAYWRFPKATMARNH